jgi:hypothetical protein
VGLDEWATLLWWNRRTQKVCVIPLLALAAGLAFSGFGEGAFLMRLAVVSVLTALVLSWITWRNALRTDDRPGGSLRVPRLLARAVGLWLLPLWPFFRVVNCPSCGHHVVGRRRLFHCGHCGWCDRFWG